MVIKSKPHISGCPPDYHQNMIDLEIHECKRNMVEAMANNKKKQIHDIYENAFDRLKSYGVSEERIPPFCAVRQFVYKKKAIEKPFRW